mmetsp:Transcript_12977/g.29880  ORF Transcript_12977/g.29880 Transcript_12977/m.29880 type:complete len:202 (+) Transcript_12977:508-1113(+)
MADFDRQSFTRTAVKHRQAAWPPEADGDKQPPNRAAGFSPRVPQPRDDSRVGQSDRPAAKRTARARAAGVASPLGEPVHCGGRGGRAAGEGRGAGGVAARRGAGQGRWRHRVPGDMVGAARRACRRRQGLPRCRRRLRRRSDSRDQCCRSRAASEYDPCAGCGRAAVPRAGAGTACGLCAARQAAFPRDVHARHLRGGHRV